MKLRNDWEERGLKVVLAGGVFDIIHPGHIHTLNAAKALGDVLVVVIGRYTIIEKLLLIYAATKHSDDISTSR